MRNLKLLILAGLFFFPFLSQEALACQCGGFNTPYTVFAMADAVFAGEVLAVTDPAGNELPSDRLPTPSNYPDFSNLFYRFQVQERFKGAESPEVTVGTSINMCQYGFGHKGGTWLVYAYKNANPKAPLSANLFCSRTDSLSAAQDDIHFLRGLLKREPEPRIYGSVQLSDRDPSGSGTQYSFLSGVEIVATSGSKRFTTVTDKNGFYRFDKLPNGKYKVVPTLPERYVAVEWLNDDEVTLTDGRPDDHLYNTALFEGTRGRSAFVELNIRARK